MALAPELLELGAIAAVYIVIGLLVIVVALVSLVAAIFNVRILGYRPFGFIGNALHNTLVSWCYSGIDDLGNIATHLESFLTWSLEELVNMSAGVLDSVRNALEWEWNNSIPGIITNKLIGVWQNINANGAGVSALWRYSAKNLSRAESYAEGRASQALVTAESYTRSVERTLNETVSSDFASAKTYTDAQVKSLQSDLASLKSYVDTVLVPLSNGVAAVPGEIANATRAASAAEAAALSASETAAANARAQIANELTAAINDVQGKEGQLGGTVAALATALAATTALTRTVAAEVSDAGLSRSSCRTKTRGICGVDPIRWAEFLAGFAVISGGFSLDSFIRDTVEAAKVVIPEIRKVVEKA